MKTALIVFAREPKEGKVKTRLQAQLPSKSVLALYKAFIEDVLAVAKKAAIDERFIFYAGAASSIPYLSRFRSRFQLKRQSGVDLGERMHRAFKRCRKEGFKRVVIIGTDCLSIRPADIETAFKKLLDYDCVLGPSKDGGYYLIGLNEPDERYFKNVQWSTDQVFKQTLKSARKLRKNVYKLPVKEDIDHFDALKAFARKPAQRILARKTSQALQRLSIYSPSQKQQK